MDQSRAERRSRRHRVLARVSIHRPGFRRERRIRARVLRGTPLENGHGERNRAVVDGGPRRASAVTLQLLRRATDGSSCFPRHWELQGSEEGGEDESSWITLRRHAGDATVCRPGAWGSWAVPPPGSERPVRFLRLHRRARRADPPRERTHAPSIFTSVPWSFTDSSPPRRSPEGNRRDASTRRVDVASA